MKLGVGTLALLPAGLTTYQFLTDQLGANPIAEAMNKYGYWTLVLLLATLACTPLKTLFGWNWPLAVRRLLGLCAFAVGSLHFLTYLVLDQFFDFAAIWEDIVKRKFITIGFLAFVLLVPLAVTSTNGMVRRLGFPRWKRLHRLTYVAAVAGVVHYVWRVKADLVEPLIFAGVLALLFAIRLATWLKTDGKGARAVRPVA
ncbi:MAG TPA: protein-methionine-sulfoxide reductase heme-binding subunit MsrQ [Polyangia bacterium]